MAQLIEYDKKFLIIGNMNAVTYKEVFPLIQKNEMWLGVCPRGMNFETPTGVENVNAVWFTNLDHTKRHEELYLIETYAPEKYPKYDNYDAIEVSKTKNIPKDYDGVMGVPITFLDKYCPEQFDIIGATESEGKGFSVGLWDAQSNVKQALVKGKRVYKRLFIHSCL